MISDLAMIYEVKNTVLRPLASTPPYRQQLSQLVGVSGLLPDEWIKL
jgi:hypothetical protein